LVEGVSELVVEGFVQTEKKIVTLTSGFIARCYGAAPVAGLPRKRPVKVKIRARSCYEKLIEDADLV
jgi:hypothetical protein